jgi:hypothetical protein
MKNLVATMAPAVPENRSSEATRALLSACKTLRRTRPHVIRSLQVTLELADLTVTNGAVEDYVERIGMEQGVATRARVEGRHVTVFLTREIDPASRPPECSKSEVVGWVSRFSSWLSR